MHDAPLLEVRGVSKTFITRTLLASLRLRPRQVVHALRDVSLEVREGRVTGLLGPNGAGKTTLINLICDLVRPDAGSVRVAGWTVADHAREAQRRVGMVTTNERSFFWRLTGRQNLRFFAALYDMPPRAAAARADALIAQFGMTEHADRLFRTYSSGMRKRLALARALLHDPPVLLMDEPTSSLDPAATDDLLELVRTQIVPAGKCVLCATHRLEEVFRLCDHVVVLIGGRIRLSATLEQFRGMIEAHRGYILDLSVPADRFAAVESHCRSLGGTLTPLDDVTEDAGRSQSGAPALGIQARASLPGVADERRLSGVIEELLRTAVYVKRVEPISVTLGDLLSGLRDEAADEHRQPSDRDRAAPSEPPCPSVPLHHG